MKKLLVLAVSILSLSAQAFAKGDVWNYSNSTGIQATIAPCVPNFFSGQPHAIFHNVCVNTGAAGSFTVYNSSGTTANPVALIDTTAKGCSTYDVQLSSGITFSNSATANVTITYQCY